MNADSTIRAVLKRLPTPLRRSFRKGENLVAGYARILKSWLLPSVSVFKGSERTEGQALTLLYCGDDVQSRNYIGLTAFGPKMVREDLGRMSVFRVRRLVRSGAKPCDAAWIEWNPVSRLVLMPRHALKLPRWVEAWLDVPDTVDEFRRKRGFKDILRRIRKHGYTYEVTRDRKLLDHFYHRMYEPTILTSHGECAYIISYPFFEHLCDNSDLLLVEQYGQYVAGILLQYEDNDAILAYLGIVDGDRDLIRDGVVGALDYFSARWLRSRGYSTVCFGGSKPFLNDGVLKTKMNRDCYLKMRKHIRDENVILAFFKESPGLKGFLSNNPFLRYSEEGTLEGVLFADSFLNAAPEMAEDLISPYVKYKGISGWQIYVFGDEGAGARSYAVPGSDAKITVQPFRTSEWKN